MRDSEVESNRLASEIQLELTVHSSHLSVTILNTVSQEIRLWDLENSWGWFSFSLYLSSELDKNIQIRERKSREWTKNGPYFFVLSPRKSCEIKLNINDGWWERSKGLPALKDEPISVRVRLKVGPSPEAEEYGVFVGTVLSDWVLSMPPHAWLFAAN